MAQVFTHSGEGFVLRGGDVAFDKLTRTVHLSKQQAFSLLKNSIQKYSEKAGAPNRVVVHKTSLFSEEEKQGFEEAIGGCKYDFVSISQNSDLRFLRTGKYPVLRGTLISLTAHEHLLYTTGYTPRVRTYPGPRIPKPLLITHCGDSEISDVCSEILGLTKLNWNTTAFSTQLPITIDFAQRVGRVLSELPQENPIQDHYKFYM
jgi:argonaute-like protein implicated in RNA metabolism and viral defense